MENKETIFKNKYQKYKHRVKLWEQDFKKKFGRIPSKYDIREAPLEVRDSYKMYYKLKTSFLEDTLSSVLSEDGFDVFEMSTEDVCSEENSSNLSFSSVSNISTLSTINLETSGSSIFQEIETDDQYVNTAENVQKNELSQVVNQFAGWDSLSKKKIESKKCEKTTDPPPFKSNLPQKLFKTSSFSKRNPRKSLSKSNSFTLSSMPSNLDNSNPVLPDLETILSQKSKEQKSSNAVVFASQKPKDIDMGWLERNTIENNLEEKIEKPCAGLSVSPKCSNKYGLSNINLDQLKSDISPIIKTPTKVLSESILNNISYSSDSDSIVSNSEDEITIETHRHIAKRRKITLISKKEPKQITDIEKTNDILNKKYDTINKLCPELPELKVPLENDVVNDDNIDPDKLKEISENKKLTKTNKTTKTVGKRISKRTTDKLEEQLLNGDEDLIEKEPELDEFAFAFDTGKLNLLPRANFDELEQADNVAKKYINTITSSHVPKKHLVDSNVNQKRTADRAKLEEKVASGKLNENFVTINMRKKVFVRGKTHLNFSRYKKSIWKKKKIAALSGPDMNMGGCDGGILTCHTCGQPGHFAQQCKIKGDNLLPLNIEVDDSEFPTLAEAEQMASQQAVLVHSKDIQKLPEASNSRIYKNQDEISQSENEDEFDNDLNELSSEIETNIETVSKAIDANCSNSKADITSKKINSGQNFDCSIKNETKVLKSVNYIGHKIPEEFLKEAGISDRSSENSRILPLYNLNDDGSVRDATSEVDEVLKMFGHTEFRKGQDKAVMRILSGLSTLVTLSTGSGKSLCYQLPAYLYSRKKRCITLVISPLVSLMEDQVTGVPNFLKAHCLHTNQTPQQRLKVLELITNNEIDILLISPEAVVAGEKSTGFGSILRKLPPIAFACIDEAHCVSQWSHNFRPSYLMICKVLKKHLGVKTILGLTATATLPTRISIIRHLGILDGNNGIISDTPLPDNLILSVSKDENRDFALLKLLQSSRFEHCQSIIIYCTRRDECERISSFLRTSLQDSAVNVAKKRRRVNWHAEPYHAGMPSSRRRTIQNAFMKNELRIVVATIAFGMGINKPDIRAVIHYNMPKSFESYVQEIGRAGRDGNISHCHLFLDSRGGDKNELKRHIYANSIDRHVIRKLLQRIFIPCSCIKNLKKSEFVKQHHDEIKAMQDINWDEDFQEDTENKSPRKQRICPGHEIGFSVESTVQALDIPQENISTLLCYLELDGNWGINVLSNAYIMCKVISYSGPKYLKNAAKGCPPLAMAIAVQIKNETFNEQNNILEFSIIDIASAIGWNSGIVKYQMKNLEWTTENGCPKRSPLSVAFYDLGFRIMAAGDFQPDEIDEALDKLYTRSVQQEKTQIVQLQNVFNGLSSVSYRTCTQIEQPEEMSLKLKAIVREYFSNNSLTEINNDENEELLETSKENIMSDVQTMINMYPENNFTGRTLARIFHGIQSPNFPAVIWGRCKFWRAHSKSDFNTIIIIANSVIIKLRS